MTNLVFENRMKPNYSLVPNEPAGDLMNDMTAEMETPDRNFVDAILGRDVVQVPPECGLRVIELTEAAWESAKVGAPVSVQIR